MKIALIGPTNIDLMSEVSGISKETYINSARKIASLIAKYNHELIVVPDRGIAVEGLNAYNEANGLKVIAIAPSKGVTEYQKSTVKCDHNINNCHEVITDIDWNEQHSLICKLADLMVCCGISCGTISEMAWTKWIEKPIVYVCEDTISCLPPEMIAEAHIKFIKTADNFESILQKYNKQQ